MGNYYEKEFKNGGGEVLWRRMREKMRRVDWDKK